MVDVFERLKITTWHQVESTLDGVGNIEKPDLAGEEGDSLLAIVTLVWMSREAAATWLSGGGQRALLATLRPHTRGDVITKFLRVEHERGRIERHTLN